MKLDWQRCGFDTLRQAKGTYGEFKIDIGPYGVRLYFEQHFIGLWDSTGRNSEANDLNNAMDRAQEEEDSEGTKKWI